MDEKSRTRNLSVPHCRCLYLKNWRLQDRLGPCQKQFEFRAMMERRLRVYDRTPVDLVLSQIKWRFLWPTNPDQDFFINFAYIASLKSHPSSSASLSPQAPRLDAVSILGSLLALPTHYQLQGQSNVSVLRRGLQTTSVPWSEIKDALLERLLRWTAREPLGISKEVTICSLGIFMYQELANYDGQRLHPRMKEAMLAIYQALRLSERQVRKRARWCCVPGWNVSPAIVADRLRHVGPAGRSRRALAAWNAGPSIESGGAVCASLAVLDDRPEGYEQEREEGALYG